MEEFVMTFDKAMNFRELGGLKGADGRTVKHGCFYRSGMLSRFKSAGELEELQRLGIKVILDFRSRFEAEAEPDPVLPGAEYHNICALLDENGEEMEFSPDDIKHIFESEADMIAECNKMMKIMYSEMAFGNPAFKKLFCELEKGNVPVLFHCSAGKDRTGVAAILILLALGADEKTALDDYELTNEYRKEAIEEVLSMHKEEIERNPEIKTVYSMMEGVSRKAGELVIERIKERYGSFEKYFEEEYGLNKGGLEHLRDMYLE
jgi:protein-tyrosine phosphatase